MNILIVEDDPYVLKDISGKLKDLGYSKLNKALNYASAVETIEQNEPDLAILDIDLSGKKDGIDVGAFLSHRGIPFIYLSDMQDTTTLERALKTEPAANLDKPVSGISLRNAIAIALTKTQKNTESEQFIVVPSGSRKIKIDPMDILYLKAAKNNCEIHLRGAKPIRYLSSTPMGNVLTVLNRSNFCQVHRSYVINLFKVHSYQGGRVFMSEDLSVEIPISPTYLANFKIQFKSI